jgi:2-dehydropantoate 2-reductase
MEIDPMVTAVAELGDLTGIDTPVIDMILALVRQRARLAGCY